MHWQGPPSVANENLARLMTWHGYWSSSPITMPPRTRSMTG
jgi:hypothetical protein